MDLLLSVSNRNDANAIIANELLREEIYGLLRNREIEIIGWTNTAEDEEAGILRETTYCAVKFRFIGNVPQEPITERNGWFIFVIRSSCDAATRQWQ